MLRFVRNLYLVSHARKILWTLPVISSFLFLASPDALASSWCHEFATASNNTRIEWDFIPVEYWTRFESNSTWRTLNYIHVANEGFTGNEKVVIVVIDYRAPSQPSVRSVETKYDAAAHRFTANLEQATFFIHSYWNTTSYQEVAVAVDDVWLNDPASGKSNFVFAATRYASFCPNP